MKDSRKEGNTVIIGADHAGFRTKQEIIDALVAHGHTIVDVGSFDEKKPDDYPDVAAEVAHAVASDTTGRTRGILVCGSGTGMAIAANKVRGIRAAFAFDTYSAKMARHDNDANVLTLRGRKFPRDTAAKLAVTFLSTPFSGIPRHKRRIKKVRAIEQTRTSGTSIPRRRG